MSPATDRGLALLSHRDRTSVGVARKRWSAAPVDPGAPHEWRNVSGRSSRQLLRTIEHTDAVHGFLASLATQARERSLEVVQLDPPRRASRYFRHDDRLHSVQPDAFGGPASWRRRAAFLPGMGATGRASSHDGLPPRPLPALLRLPQAYRRPRGAAECPRGVRRRTGGHALPASGTGGDGACQSGDPAVGFLQEAGGARGVAGRRLAGRGEQGRGPCPT